MKYTFVQFASFVDRWRRLRLRDDDLQALEKLISENPAAGAVIPGTGGPRKVRFAPPSLHRGKRGATRVCYASFVVGATVYLFTIYAKNVQEDITADEKRLYWRLLSKLKGLHHGQEERTTR